MRAITLSLLLLVLAFAANAGDVGWIGRDGKPVPEDDAQRSVGGFGGWLVVTPDEDWEAKWNTPPETVPNFTTASTVEMGETLTVLIFFGNPAVGPGQHIEVGCDLIVTRPDGTRSVDSRDMECAAGPLQGDPMNVRLAQPFLRYIGEEGDPLGTWSVQVTLYDRLRHVAVPLKTTFTLVPRGS